MAHPAYSPIITLKQFRKCERPHHITKFIDKSHVAAPILAAICMEPYKVFTISEFAQLAGFITGHVNARVEFWLMRINDTLPRAGWEINFQRRLQRISVQHENRLILKLGRAA